MKALQDLRQAEARQRAAKADLDSIKAEARQVWHKAQQPPGTEGAAAARLELAEIEGRIPAAQTKLDAANQAVDTAKQAAREAGVKFGPDVHKKMQQLEAGLVKLAPLAEEILADIETLRVCNVNPPGISVKEEYHLLRSFLPEIPRQLAVIGQLRARR